MNVWRKNTRFVKFSRSKGPRTGYTNKLITGMFLPVAGLEVCCGRTVEWLTSSKMLEMSRKMPLREQRIPSPRVGTSARYPLVWSETLPYRSYGQDAIVHPNIRRKHITWYCKTLSICWMRNVEQKQTHKHTDTIRYVGTCVRTYVYVCVHSQNEIKFELL